MQRCDYMEHATACTTEQVPLLVAKYRTINSLTVLNVYIYYAVKPV